MQATLKNAYQLIHEGAEALAEISATGMRIDVPYLKKTILEVGEQIKEKEANLRNMDEYKLQRKRFAEKTNLGSRQQLAEVLFKDLKFVPKEYTASDRVKLDEKALELIGSPYTKEFVRVEKLKKLKGTYLEGVLVETVGDLLRPNFNLHFATTYRSSSSDINFQNIPIRDPEISELIRTAFIPRDGHVLLEIDYSALEFRVASMFWKDPLMMEYASDPEKDIHRDCAAEIWRVVPELVSKQARYCAKNQFVFPQIYGDYYVNNAITLWESIDKFHLENGQDVGMREHLEEFGILGRGACDHKNRPVKGTFENHVKNVQNTFYEWFPEFSKSKEVWWKEYCKNGYFRLMTGFVISGVYKKNFVFNAPIQGPAFHLVLWSIPQLTKWIRREKMRSRVIGQIHDSILVDTHKSELQDVLVKARQVMTEDIRDHWSWITVPLEIECEVGETNWHLKKPYRS